MKLKTVSVLIIFSFIFLFSSCHSTKQLLSKEIENPISYNLENINSKFENIYPKDTTAFRTLWQTLYLCKTFKKDTTKISQNQRITLKYDGKKYLTVSLSKNDSVINKFTLKAKKYEDYLSIKRNWLLIPIPFIFFKDFYYKAMISNDKNGDLMVKVNSDQSLWILIMAGGVNSTNTLKYKKKSN